MVSARKPDFDADFADFNKPSQVNGEDQADFEPEPWVWRDPAKMPPRQWLLGTTFLRGYASLIGGVGGIGKTSRGVASALAVITGRHKITGEHVFQTGKAWLITLEDDRPELERRIAAAMILHNIKREEVEGTLFINDMSRSSKRPLVLITTDDSSNPKISVDAERIAENIREHGILFTVVDPLIKAHRGIENRNEHMDAICDVLNGIAKDTNASVVLAAHFRTGGGNDGSADAFRGGSALVDATRGGGDRHVLRGRQSVQPAA
jgi:RecA-family ATPase